MRLDELLKDTGARLVRGDGATPVEDLSDDSRRVGPGCAFIARSGSRCDGRSYVDDAIQSGAVAVISESPPGAHRGKIENVAWAVVPQVDQALAGRLAGRFFGQPGRKLKLVGITGTNGKTTTTFLTQHLLKCAGCACGMLSTVWNDDGRIRTPSQLTTPGPIDLNRALARMVSNGCEAAVIEVSSHALDQGRTAGLHFDVGVFTNLTGDHLDYHLSMDNYADAKAALFEGLNDRACAVLNADDAHAGRMSKTAARILRCRLNAPLDEQTHCAASVVELGARQSQARFEGPWGRVDVKLPLIGRHNVLNALFAAAAASAARDLSRSIRKSLESCPTVPGRLEAVGSQGAAGAPAVLVDYAHTHDALENVLLALKPLSRGRLVVVFGCGGDRDRTKRPKMGAVACRLADRAILTNDNPRTEDPATIIKGVLEGVPPDALGRVVQLPDRRAAIRHAIAAAGPDDLVLVAGKGHEDYQIVGRQKQPFDDRLVAAEALRERLAQPAAANSDTVSNGLARVRTQ